MGIRDATLNCRSKPLIKMRWELWSDDELVSSGSSDDHYSGGYQKGVFMRDIGAFQCSAGKKYLLVLDILQNGSMLEAAKPYLTVRVSETFYEDMLVVGAKIDLLFILLELTGSAFIIWSVFYWKKARHRNK